MALLGALFINAGKKMALKNKKLRRKGKKHRPMQSLSNPLNLLSHHTTMNDGQKTDLSLAYGLSLQLLLTSPDEQSWATVASTCNIAMILCEMGYGREFEEDFKLALEGLQRAKDRALEKGSWALDGAAITAVKDAISMHDQQIELCTVGEISHALEVVYRRIDAGIAFQHEPKHRGN